MSRMTALTRYVRAAPETAAAKILAAYEAANGWPDDAARRLGICVWTLRYYNRQLGLRSTIRKRYGHGPGWLGARAYRTTLVRREQD
jgi:hypothetical protein